MKSSKCKRSPCPIACALDILGDKWTLLVIRDLHCGRRFFNEFCRSPEGIATNILADRLDKLCQHKLVEKYSTSEVPIRDAYRLTKKGKSLRPILESLAAWGLSHIEGTSAKMKLQDE